MTLKQTEEEKTRLEEELTRVKSSMNIIVKGILFFTLILGQKHIKKGNYKS